MIRKLRWKFVGICMALVGLVLLVVFSAVCLTSYQRLRADSLTAMRLALQREAGTPPERFALGKDHGRGGTTRLLPIFSITLDTQGHTRFVDAGNVDVTNEEAEEAAKAALAQGKVEGVLPALQLRYLREDTPKGTQIAFYDLRVEDAEMRQLILQLALAGFGGLVALFLLSLLLSGWALRPVERAWRQQRQFIADASHELKTPLTVMLANLGILASHPHETIEAQKKWLDNTQTEAGRMKKLVEDLLFLAKSDAARVPMRWARLSLSDTIWSVLLPFEPLAYDRGIRIRSEIPPGLMMDGDEAQLKQLTAILLDNANKYAGKGGEIFVRLKSGQDHLRLTVRNTGQPIPKEHLEHLFERFYRVDSARVRSKGGYGLGLSIAAQIVENHHGQIDVESDVQKGTTFMVRLQVHGGPKGRAKQRCKREDRPTEETA